MLGRAVLVLCLLTGAALACPPEIETPQQDAELAAAAVAHDDSFGLIVAFTLMGFCALGFVITRGNAVRRTFATSRHFDVVELEVVKRVARIQRDRAALFALICAAVLYGSTRLSLAPGALFFVSATPLLLLGIAMVAVCRLQVLMGLHAEPALRAFSHGDYLFAARGTRLVDWVAASPGLLARASSLPAARVR